MKDTVANEVIEGLKDAGVKFASFLPDSWLRPIYSRLVEDPHFTTIPVSNEGGRGGTLLRRLARRHEGGDAHGEYRRAHGLRSTGAAWHQRRLTMFHDHSLSGRFWRWAELRRRAWADDASGSRCAAHTLPHRARRKSHSPVHPAMSQDIKRHQLPRRHDHGR